MCHLIRINNSSINNVNTKCRLHPAGHDSLVHLSVVSLIWWPKWRRCVRASGKVSASRVHLIHLHSFHRCLLFLTGCLSTPPPVPSTLHLLWCLLTVEAGGCPVSATRNGDGSFEFYKLVLRFSLLICFLKSQTAPYVTFSNNSRVPHSHRLTLPIKMDVIGLHGISTQGGKLEIAGTVVGQWAGTRRSRGRGGFPVQVVSVGGTDQG